MGNSTGTNGSDIISINPKTGAVEFWDSKVRTATTKGKISPTFENDRTRNNAIEEAKQEILINKRLPKKIKGKAIENLRDGNFTTYTVGSSKVKSSVIQKYCNNQKCN